MYPQIRVKIRFSGKEFSEYLFFDTVEHVRRYVSYLLREKMIESFVGLGWVWFLGSWFPEENLPKTKAELLEQEKALGFEF